MFQDSMETWHDISPTCLGEICINKKRNNTAIETTQLKVIFYGILASLNYFKHMFIIFFHENTMHNYSNNCNIKTPLPQPNLLSPKKQNPLQKFHPKIYSFPSPSPTTPRLGGLLCVVVVVVVGALRGVLRLHRRLRLHQLRQFCGGGTIRGANQTCPWDDAPTGVSTKKKRCIKVYCKLAEIYVIDDGSCLFWGMIVISCCLGGW